MKWLRRIVNIASLLLIAGAGVAFTAFRFAFPSMTETQLLIAYWPLLIPMVLGMVGHWWASKPANGTPGARR